jgi:hypothetical protein
MLPPSPLHRYTATQAKTTTHRASPRSTAPIGVFIITREPLEGIHAIALDRRKEATVASTAPTVFVTASEKNGFLSSPRSCRKKPFSVRWTIGRVITFPHQRPWSFSHPLFRRCYQTKKKLAHRSLHDLRCRLDQGDTPSCFNPSN